MKVSLSDVLSEIRAMRPPLRPYRDIALSFLGYVLIYGFMAIGFLTVLDAFLFRIGGAIFWGAVIGLFPAAFLAWCERDNITSPYNDDYR
jgi:NhaP-type Na+/H+ or K+/H+ antiporter